MTQVSANDSENKIPVIFYLYNLKFTPLQGYSDSHNSISILRDVVTFIQQNRDKKKGFLIDKFAGREGNAKRLIFASNMIFHKERKIRGQLVLIRTGKNPFFKPKDEFRLIPLEELQKDKGYELAEKTNFFIDVSGKVPHLCIEYNHNGPRIDDLVYYLRQIAHNQLHLAKATKADAYMKDTLANTLERLRDVMKLRLKIRTKNIAKVEDKLKRDYLANMSAIGHVINSKAVAFQAYFDTPGVARQPLASPNKQAVTMVKEVLSSIKNKPASIELFDDFVVDYEDVDGEQQQFNLDNEKWKIEKEIAVNTIRKNRDWFTLVEDDFNEFIEGLKK